MAYDCRDVGIILRQLKFKKSQSTNTFHNERKKVFEPMFVFESKRKDTIKSWSFMPLTTFITSTWRHWFLTLLTVYILRIRNNQNHVVANRYSSIRCIKDKSIATCADVTRLLLMFENLRLTLAKKRCEWECNKTIISENFCVFPFVKTSGYHLKVFVFKLNQIHTCQATIVEKHLRRHYVRMNSMSKSKSWQIMVHFARG